MPKYLIPILALAAFLYLFKISSVPNGLYVDETTVGYNAFSILQTGKDEFGKAFPLAFRLFGAYTPPLFIYLLVPIIKIFGLSSFSLRFLSVLLTLFGIILVFGFVKKMTIYRSGLTPYLAAIIFAVSPWVVFYARVGYEVTLGYILFTGGALLIWSSLQKKNISIIGLLLLSLSTYAAHTERYLAPLFILAIFLVFFKTVISPLNPKKIFTCLLVLFISQIPNFYLVTTKAFWVKSDFYSDTGIASIVADIISQYLTYLSPSAIFGISPDINLQHTAPMLPLMYSWLILPFFIGLYHLSLNLRTPEGKYISFLFLLSAVPGALSGQFISTQRVLPLIVPLVLIISIGLDRIFTKLGKIVLVPLTLLLVFSLVLLWRSYFVLLPTLRASSWNYGHSQLAQIISSHPDTLFIIDDTRLNPTYANLLFYSKHPPSIFQEQFPPQLVSNYYSNLPLTNHIRVANAEFRPIVWKEDIYRDYVLVGDALSISSDQAKEHYLDLEFNIKDPTGQTVLVGYQTNPKKKSKN